MISNLLVINGKEYIDLKNAVEYIKVLDSENHMEKYNIKRFKQDIAKIKYNFKKDIEKNIIVSILYFKMMIFI